MINIGLVGFGKIALDQHLPALAASRDFKLIAITKGAHGPPAGARSFDSLEDLAGGCPDLHAVTLCTPPQERHSLAAYAIDRGLHVMLEKPPGQTTDEVGHLIDAARRKSVALFGTWHSREAPAVEPARQWLANADIRYAQVQWREDVRHWHPGQSWIWNPGGMGVFDAGINALSIVTRIMPRPLLLASASLSVPINRSMPIAATLRLTDSVGIRVLVDLDWRERHEQVWSITVHAKQGVLRLSQGGAALSIDDKPVVLAPEAEYPALYGRFAALVAAHAVDADLAPLQLVCEAFEKGEQISTAAFEE